MKKLGVILITKNNQDTVEKTLKSILWFDEIVIVDDFSTDETIKIIKKISQNKKNIFLIQKKFSGDIGKQRNYGLKFLKTDWVFIIDSDEIISKKLKNEIKNLDFDFLERKKIYAFQIPYENYFLGKRLKYGGENYQMLRFFKRKYLEIRPSIIHNQFILKKGKISSLKGKIIHHSYRSITQLFKKFTDYAIKTAKIKSKKGEKSSLKKIIFYPLHMFYARFIKDKGYKDGFLRIILDLAFAYMEFLTYILLFFYQKKR